MAREMKNSGVEWIGEIPKDWILTRIKYICESFGRIGFRGYTENDLVDEGEGAITISPSNMKNMKMDYSKCSYLSWFKYEESPEIKLSNNDVLFVKTGSTYGKTAIVENLPMEATINPQLLIFKNIKISTKFFFYNFQTPYIKSQIENAVVGGTIPTIAQGKINNFFFILPPLFEQKAIADFLDDKCTEIDGLLSDLDAEVKTLTEYKKSIIVETVTHGLNPQATLVPTNLGWIDKIPKHWAIARIASVYSVRNEKVSDKDFPPLSVTMKGIVPQLESAAKTKHGDDRKLIRKGDFVINSRSDRRGSCGISDYDGSCSLINTVLAPREEMNPRYYNWLFHTTSFADEFYKWGYGIVDDLWTTNWGAMRRIQIPMPPLDEQAKIAAYLDEKIPYIEQAIADKQTQIETLKSYKASLIYEYVTGKKQVI